MAGRPRKPTSLKVVAGTERKDRAVIDPVELPLVSASPEPPDWLPNSHAVKEWDRLAPILTANKLLTEAGCSALGHLCALHGKIVQLWAAGEAPTGHMLAQYRNLVNDFGLTPVAQGKVKPAGKEADANPFARNGQRKAS
jgi:phage terminase small subunit